MKNMWRIVFLFLQPVLSQVIYDETFIQTEQAKINYQPGIQNFGNQTIIYITLTILSGGNIPILQVCTDTKCRLDYNQIDFEQLVQIVRIMDNADDYDQQKKHAALPFTEIGYVISVQSNNKPCNFNLKIEISNNMNCYLPCKHDYQCVSAECLCQDGYTGIDCSILTINIVNVEKMFKNEIFYYLYQDHIGEQFTRELSEMAMIKYSCIQKTRISEERTLNITLEMIQDCMSYSQDPNYPSYIVLRLISPQSVDFVTSTIDTTSESSVLAIVIGCLSGFLLIIIGVCIRRCRKDSKKQLKKAAKIILLNDVMPAFNYFDAISKYPGLKDDCECLICLIPFKSEDEIRLTHCSHIFHRECIELWQEKNKTCPICRATLDKKFIDNIINLNQDELHLINPRGFNQSNPQPPKTEIDFLHRISTRLLGTNNKIFPCEQINENIVNQNN